MIQLNPEGIAERVVRENFQKLQELLQTNPFLAGEFKHFEEAVTKPSASYKIRHRLGFKPSDILLTWVSDGAAVSVLFDQTDRDYIVLSVDKPCTVRFLAGVIQPKQENRRT